MAHHLGTTRMSETDQTGVVDRDCRIHGMDNLYVAGSSVFPTGGWAFPTFTIVALALRLSDQLRQILSSPSSSQKFACSVTSKSSDKIIQYQ